MRAEETPKARILVTGGAGFIGTVLTRQLLDRGWGVRIFDNFSRPDRARLDALCGHDRLDVVQGDVRDRCSVDRAMAGVDLVAHLAAQCLNKSLADPCESFDVNLMGSHHVFESAAENGVQRVVFASSASVYGEAKRLPVQEDDELDPRTPYCIAKAAAEKTLRFHGERTGMGWLALRFFNVYGPGQPTDAYYTSVVLTFLRRIARGEPVAIDGDGSQTMDFVHVDDVTRAVVLALESRESGRALNVGSGTQTSIADLARVLLDYMGVETAPSFRPRDVLVKHRQADVRLIERVLGWRPELDLEEGLTTIVDDLKADGRIA